MEKIGDTEALRSHFNAVGTGLEHGSYEQRRWSQDARKEAQKEATAEFVERIAIVHLSKNTPGHLLELGPGPGTWTQVLAKAFPQVQFTLTDIAHEMLTRAKQTIADRDVTIIEGDFLSVSLPQNTFDAFFSSRALEYVGDKHKAIEKIVSTLRSGSRGCIITKTPKTLTNRITGRVPLAIHRGQVSPRMLRQYLKREGCKNVTTYPVTFAFPLLRSAGADRVCKRFFGNSRLTPLSEFFSESYGVLFEKP